MKNLKAQDMKKSGPDESDNPPGHGLHRSDIVKRFPTWNQVRQIPVCYRNRVLSCRGSSAFFQPYGDGNPAKRNGFCRFSLLHKVRYRPGSKLLAKDLWLVYRQTRDRLPPACWKKNSLFDISGKTNKRRYFQRELSVKNRDPLSAWV